MLRVYETSDAVNQSLISKAEHWVMVLMPIKMKGKNRYIMARWIIRILIIFWRSFALRLALKVIFGRISLVSFLQHPPLSEAFWFASGTASISILFKLTRLALVFLQRKLQVKFEFAELIISGAVSSLGMLLFN